MIDSKFKFSGFLAEFVSSDFNGKKTEENVYNGNPEFFQKLIDADIDVKEFEYIDVESEIEIKNIIDIGFPYASGYLYINDSNTVRVIDEEFCGYGKYVFPKNITSKEQFMYELTKVIDAYSDIFQRGVAFGKNEKIREIKSVLTIY